MHAAACTRPFTKSSPAPDMHMHGLNSARPSACICRVVVASGASRPATSSSRESARLSAATQVATSTTQPTSRCADLCWLRLVVACMHVRVHVCVCSVAACMHVCVCLCCCGTKSEQVTGSHRHDDQHAVCCVLCAALRCAAGVWQADGSCRGCCDHL